MNSKISECLKTIVSGFACLADELEKQQEEDERRMSDLQYQICESKEVLKDAAHLILGKFD